MVDSSPEVNSVDNAPVASTAVSAPQKIKTKIDGVEQEVDLADLTRDYQKYKSSEKRFEEAAQMRKQVEGLLERAQKGDLSWLKQIVSKEQLNQWAEQELLEHINWQKMPEVERRALLAERKAQELEDHITSLTQTQEREKATAIEEKAYQSIEADIVSAVEGLGYDVKVTPRFIRRIAEQLQASLEASDDPNAEPMPAKLASERAFKGYKVDAQELLSILPESEAIELIPAKLREAIRRADVNDATSQMPMRIKKQANEAEARKAPKLKRMTTDNWFEKMEKRFSN